ncbi:hypothetical protein Tco_0206135 [Tanacetum coccineum]
MEESDDEFPNYRINREDNQILPSVTNTPTLVLKEEPTDDYIHSYQPRTKHSAPLKTPTMRLIDEPTDDEFENSQQTSVNNEFDDLFDDEANEDLEGEDLLGEPTNDLPHLDDFDDAAHDDYDLSDSFIDDGPQPDDSTEDDNDSDN